MSAQLFYEHGKLPTNEIEKDLRSLKHGTVRNMENDNIN